MPPNFEKVQDSYSTRYPLKEIQQNIIQTNSVEVIDDFPNIYITRFFKNKQEKYHYKIWRLGHYPPNAKHTQRSSYLIPNGYTVGVKIYGVDIIAETRYDPYNKVVYTVTWNDNNGEKKLISSNKSASNIASLFLQVVINCCNSLFLITIKYTYNLFL